jgi:hypothetical protein
MKDYSNGKVYKIVGPNSDEECYVGSTTKSLNNRFVKHQEEYSLWKRDDSRVHFQSYDIFDLHGVHNCDIVLLEACNAKDKQELLQCEQKWMDQLHCNNKMSAYLTAQQRKENRKISQHQSDLKHIDKRRETRKAYNIKNKDRMQENYYNNIEHNLKLKKEYYSKNKETLLEKAQQLIHCDVCNCDVQIYKICRHNRTIKHLKNQETKK